MKFNDFHIQIATAFPNVEEVTSSKNLVLRGEIQTDDGKKFAYIKLLDLEGIAKEALSAVLARVLHLPVKQPYYVDISNTSYSNKGNVDGVTFGLLDDTMTARQVRTREVEDELLKWDGLLRCGVFDEWIANVDRYPNNLMHEEYAQFWLIDHEEAFRGFVSPSSPANSQLLGLVARGLSEFELHKKREEGLRFVEEFKKINWHEIKGYLMPENVRGINQLFNRYIEFLVERIPHMYEILGHSLGIKQEALKLDKKDDKKMEFKK